MRPLQNLLIRDAEDRDAGAIAEMSRQLAVRTGSPPGLMTPEVVTRDLINGAGLSVIVADADGETVGYSLFTVAYETAFAARGVYMTDLCVDERWRRRGVARALVREIARRTVADGGRYIWWVVTADNAPAQAFYATLRSGMAEVQARFVAGENFDALLSDE